MAKRIPVTVSDEQLEVVEKLMKQEDRSRAYIASMIFSDGLKLVESELITVIKNDLDGK